MVVLKATYTCEIGDLPKPKEPQIPIVETDVYYGDCLTTSVQYEAELVAPKPTTDIVAVGHAYPPGGQMVSQMDVGLRVGDVSKVIRVFGDRWWEFGVLGNRQTPPQPFEKMPLIYERAYGGEDRLAEPGKGKREPRNPVGQGFYWAGCPDKNPSLPNLEDPRALIKTIRDKPPPACFGFVGRHWKPRVDWVGTYDDAWRNSRFPLVAKDFNPRYYNAAHPDLITPQYLRGDEPVETHNLTPQQAVWAFQLPGLNPRAEVTIGSSSEAVGLQLDTLLLLPDSRSFVIYWRGMVDVHNRLLKVVLVKVREH